MFVVFVCIGLLIAPFYLIVKAMSNKGGSVPPKTSSPKRKNPIDKHMDENYGDVDWLRKGKL